MSSLRQLLVTKRWWLLAAVVLVALLAFAACEDDEEEAGPAATPTPETVTEEAEEAVTEEEEAAIPAAHNTDPIALGFLCDRTGPTALIGTVLCPGYSDYIDLINSQGGVGGHLLDAKDFDHGYQVEPAVTEYEAQKAEGIVIMINYGTPIALALQEAQNADQIPGLTPGFGIAPAASPNYEFFDYVFPLAATYWSQGAAAVQYIADQEGDLSGLKIAYLFYDNAAGNEPIPVIERLSDEQGFDLETYAVPPPGSEQSATWLSITQDFEADWVIAHLFGAGPGVSIQEANRLGFALDHLVSLVWGTGESDIEAAGGFGEAQGYTGLQFFGVGVDFPAVEDIIAMYEARGEDPPDTIGKVYYNRGVAIAALVVEAIRIAHEAVDADPITGADVKAGLESISNFTLGGLIPPMNVTPTDHEGGGWTQVWQIEGDGWVLVQDSFVGFRDTVQALLDEVE